MKVILKIAHPKNDKERLFKLEVHANDLKNPVEVTLPINGKEYLLEIHFDRID